MFERKYCVNVDAVVNDRMFEHVRFLAQVSVPAAERLFDLLQEAIAELETSPESCPPYNLHNQADIELRYKLCGKRYRIVFEIIDTDVHVYDIQDCRQDSDKNLI